MATITAELINIGKSKGLPITWEHSAMWFRTPWLKKEFHKETPRKYILRTYG